MSDDKAGLIIETYNMTAEYVDDANALVKAARKFEQRAREEAEWLQNEGYKRGMYLEQDCDEFLAAIKRFTREA